MTQVYKEGVNVVVVRDGMDVIQIPTLAARYDIFNGAVTIKDKQNITGCSVRIPLSELEDGSSNPLSSKALVDAAFRQYFGE